MLGDPDVILFHDYHKMFMARIFTVAYHSVQILEWRNAKRCCWGNTATLNQKRFKKPELEEAIKNWKTHPKSDRADKMFLLLKKERRLYKATLTLNLKLLLDILLPICLRSMQDGRNCLCLEYLSQKKRSRFLDRAIHA